MANKQFQFKLVLLGEAAVGKSSLVLRFVKGHFTEYQESTIGAAFMTQTLALDDTTVKFEIWDTAGQERYHSLAPMYYRGAQAAVVVYDVTSQDSFERAQRWISELRDQANRDIVIALAGNKVDLCQDSSGDAGGAQPNNENAQDGDNQAAANDSTTRRAVEREEAQAYAQENKLIFYETSAKTGEMVHDLFLQIAQDLPKETPGQGRQVGAQRRGVDLNSANSNSNGDNPLAKCCN